jgi:type IV secretion system protein VirD4
MTERGIPVGFDAKGRQLIYRKEGHVLIVAPPRAGKATDFLIPLLLRDKRRSIICIDPKGQLAAVTGPQRARIGKVKILNPYKILPNVLAPGASRFKGLDDRVTFFARVNPMNALDPESDSFHADLANLGDFCFDGVSRQGWGETHWTESGQDLFSGVAGHLLVNETDEHLKNLPSVRRVLKSARLLRRCAYFAQMEKGGQDESVAATLEPFIKKDADNKNEIASIQSTARTQTRFLNVRAVANCLQASDFEWTDLRREPTTVYVILPVKYLKTCARFFRLMLADCLSTLLGNPDGLPVLCIADEFAQLGKLDMIADILALGAGLNIQLMPVVQDLNQLKDIYGERWPSFLASSGAQIFTAPRDYVTSEEISKLCGDTTVEVASESSGTQRDLLGAKTGSQQGESINRTQRRTLLPQEIRQLADDRFLLFTDALPGRFIAGHRKPYWATDDCNGLYSPDPYHPGSKHGSETA